jgi:hypothetical protein
VYPDTTFTFDDGSRMLVKHEGPGNQINADENGGLNGFTWGRRTHNAGATYTYEFSFERGKPGQKILAAPAFELRQNQLGNIFNEGDPISFSLIFPKEHYGKVLGNVDEIFVESIIHDAWQRPVKTQTIPVDFKKAEEETEKLRKLAFESTSPKLVVAKKLRRGQTLVPVQLEMQSKGWFAATFSLKDRAGKLVPYPVSTTFSIVVPSEALHNLPLSERPETYEFNGFLGLRSHREGIRLKDLFVQSDNVEKPDLAVAAGGDLLGDNEDEDDEDEFIEEKKPEKKKQKKLVGRWKGLDQQMDFALKSGTKYGVKVFWLMEDVDWLGNDLVVLEQALYQIVDRYKDKNKYWMLFNEPNLRMSPKDYVTRYLNPLHRASKRADAKSMVMGPDTCGLNPGWLKAVYDAGGKMDIIDMHPYTGHHRCWEEHGMAETWKAVRKVMADHGDAEKEIWSTESGYLWSLGRLGPLNQAKHIVRQYPIAESIGIPREHFFLYYTCFVGYHKMYLVQHDFRLMPAAVAMRVQSEQLAGTKFVRQIEIGKDLLAFLYRGNDHDVLMAWSLDFRTEAEILFGGRSFKVVDMMGNEVEDVVRHSVADASPKRNVTLPLSGNPVYVRLDKEANIEPSPRKRGSNLSRQKGTKALASAEVVPNAASRVIDGITTTENTGSYEGKVWTAAKSITETGTAWLEIQLPGQREINEVHIYAPSSICGMPGLRSFEVQVKDDGEKWMTVASVKDSEESWVFHIEFKPVRTARIRLFITGLNNGFRLEDKTPYTDMKPRVTEVEIYGN